MERTTHAKMYQNFMFIPVFKPILSKNASKYLLDSLNSSWISSKGPFVWDFEKNFAKYLGVKYAVTTTSGTAALHLALSAVGIGREDEVIVPAFTMIAPLFATLYTGAKPVLVDADPDTWNIETSLIEKKITKKTKAIIPVHIYGHPVDMDPIISLAKKYGLFIIEDVAEALGAEYKGRKVGTFGDLSCFSFYANKTVTTGEGGMVITSSKRLYERLLLLRDMAHSPKKRFLHTDLGFTYRMTNLQAALGLAQLEEIDNMVKLKRNIASFYNAHLANTLGLTLPPEETWAKNIYWTYCILAKKNLSGLLNKKGIDTRDFFIPMHKQPVFNRLGLFKKEKYPVAEYLSKHGFYIPSGPDISKKQLEYICNMIKDIYEV